MVSDCLFGRICYEKRVNLSDVHIIFVGNDVGDADRIQIAIQDNPYLILNRKPGATGWLQTRTTSLPDTTATNSELGNRNAG